MGCDIHAHIEFKVGNKWLHGTMLDINRDYALFYKMAGVRFSGVGGDTPISIPKGLPDNISDTTKYFIDYWDTDAHSRSWLGAKEIKTLMAWCKKNNRDYFTWTGSMGLLFYFMPAEDKKIQDYRLVFWFDN